MKEEYNKGHSDLPINGEEGLMIPPWAYFQVLKRLCMVLTKHTSCAPGARMMT